jgi:hypothetical protein
MVAREHDLGVAEEPERLVDVALHRSASRTFAPRNV